jgi:RHS repeat-associated protein
VTPPAGGAINLSYDQANRLTAYGTTSTYAYNGDSLRMSKTISGSTSQFLWNLAGSLPAMTKDGSTAYVNGPGGLPLEQMNGSTVIWLHHDQLGSTRLATDGVGATQATYAFDAYGNLTAASGTISNPFRFAGQYIDAESGLYYLQARYFDAGTGQFLSRDPAIVATRTPYEYVNDNPLNGVDPSGLFAGSSGMPANATIHSQVNPIRLAFASTSLITGPDVEASSTFVESFELRTASSLASELQRLSAVVGRWV